MPDGNEGEDDFFAPEGGSVDWGNTDPEVIFQKRNQAWEISTGKLIGIHAAARTGNTWGIRRNIEKGVDINEYDADGFAPVHDAALGGKLESIQLLAEDGADIDA